MSVRTPTLNYSSTTASVASGNPSTAFPIRFIKAEFVESSDPIRFIRVNLHVSGQISQGTFAHRHHLVEFTIRHEICKSCSSGSSSISDRVTTRVELHQDPNRRRNFLIPLSRHRRIIGRAIRIQVHDMRTDIVFSDRTRALDCVQFFEGLFPVKKQSSDDDGVFSLHILPICPDDLIRLPAAVSASLPGGAGNLFLCTEVAAHGISLMDPFTPRTAFLTAEDYWRAPFNVALHFKLMVEYLVLDIVVITPTDPPPSNEDAGDDDSFCLAHAHIVRVSDLGKRDGHHQLMVRTHLGRLLKPGDYALGYDVGGAGDPATEVILVMKLWDAKKNKKTTMTSIGEPSSREPRSVDTGPDGIRKDEYEELSRELEEKTRLGLINSSPHQISKESRMLPTSSDGVPSNPFSKWFGDEAAADNATMEWLPATQLSSHQQESKPSVKDEPSSVSKSAPVKGVASADSKTGLVPSAVPITEEEIKSVLLATAPVTLPDLIANLRIKSQEDKKAFADVIMRISKIWKMPNGNKYIVPKDK